MQNLRSLRPLALVLVLGLLVAACGDDDTEAATTTTTTGTDATTTTEAAPEDGPTVTIQDFDFGQPVTVAAGEPITIVNEDGVTHTFTADDGSFDTGGIDGGGSASITVDAPGEYTFHCSIHPSMTGSITVEG